jgi:hypothetical protein
MNQSKVDEEESSELVELAKLVNVFLNIGTVSTAKKSALVRFVFAFGVIFKSTVADKG